MLGEDEFVGDVPDAAGDGGIGEYEVEFVDVALDLAAVLLVATFAALVVDDEHSAIWAGSGGAALARRCWGETLLLTLGYNPHWYPQTLWRWVPEDYALPVDMHEVIALCAPRPDIF